MQAARKTGGMVGSGCVRRNCRGITGWRSANNARLLRLRQKIAGRLEISSGSRRAWGLAVQLYALRREGDGGVGDFAALEELAPHAAAFGASAIAISPVHAAFAADPLHCSPYAPSSRALLNGVYADPGDASGLPSSEGCMVDWAQAATARLAALRRVFAAMQTRPATELRAAFARFRATRGERLELHARFEALHHHLFTRDPRLWDWHHWPASLQDPLSAAVAAFAEECADEVAFHAFLQFAAERGLERAQREAVAAGMEIGLIADLAIGVHNAGSDAWAQPAQLLSGLTIGAPGDILNPQGQDWGVTTFSPEGLMAHGFSAFLDMLRAALRHSGGVRIDHVMGLGRLWVVPQGAGPADGAYLRFPMRDLLRLVRLELRRHRAIVIGEDLGTVPEGFQQTLESSGLAGMRVLWFERHGETFKPPREWSRDAVAMTTTHDLPTVAGWWRGRDIEWQSRLGRGDPPAARRAREHDRAALWSAFQASDAAEGEMPAPEEPARVVDAACAHIGRAACALVLLPIEDALGLEEQPNLPGTVDEHPNWRRRLPASAETLLGEPRTASRLRALAKARLT